MSQKRPIVLCILDGWGLRPATDDNAISTSRTPNWDRFLQVYPSSQLSASGLDVGLPEGQMGNSEVGHMNIGAGRRILQDLPKITETLSTGSIEEEAVFKNFVQKTKAATGTVHMMGLLSPGGVHSSQEHLENFCRFLTKNGLSVKVHAFLDGRDTPPLQL